MDLCLDLVHRVQPSSEGFCIAFPEISIRTHVANPIPTNHSFQLHSFPTSSYYVRFLSCIFDILIPSSICKMTLNIKALCLNFLAKEKYTHVFVSQSNKVEGLNYLNILPLFQNVCHFFIDIIIIHFDIYYI
jgi:hypothetical protein